jgi:hypothetical protein
MAWLEAIGLLDANRFVFIDETGTHIGMTRLYARAVRGEPAVGVAPRFLGATLTLISALSPDGIQADMVIDGAVNGDIFVAFVQQLLVPTLRPGQVVISANSPSAAVLKVKPQPPILGQSYPPKASDHVPLHSKYPAVCACKPPKPPSSPS